MQEAADTLLQSYDCRVDNPTILLPPGQFDQNISLLANEECWRVEFSLAPRSQVLFSGLPLSFLLQSGADDCFIDQDGDKQSNIFTEALLEPKLIFDLDGSQGNPPYLASHAQYLG